MVNHPENINPNLCPICHNDNRCGNISVCTPSKDCWCRAAEITFSEKLLNQVPEEAKNKACICQACALANR